MSETYHSDNSADHGSVALDAPVVNWPARERRSLVRADSRDRQAIATLREKQQSIYELPWRQRMLHLGQVARLGNLIASREGMIRARQEMYGPYPSSGDSDQD